jgi:hypothetical protein
VIVGIAIALIGLGLAASDPKPRSLRFWIAELALIAGLTIVCGWISVILGVPPPTN